MINLRGLSISSLTKSCSSSRAAFFIGFLTRCNFSALSLVVQNRILSIQRINMLDEILMKRIFMALKLPNEEIYE